MQVVQVVIPKPILDRVDSRTLIFDELNDPSVLFPTDSKTSLKVLGNLEVHSVDTTKFPQPKIMSTDHTSAASWDELHEAALEALDTAQWLNSILVELNSSETLVCFDAASGLHMASLEKILENMYRRGLMHTEDILTGEHQKVVLEFLSERIVDALNDSGGEKISFVDFALIFLGGAGMTDTGGAYWKRNHSA